MSKILSIILKLLAIIKALLIDFFVAFGSVFVSVAIFYSFNVPNEWKIPNIIIPIIAVFVYRVLGRLLKEPLKKFKEAKK